MLIHVSHNSYINNATENEMKNYIIAYVNNTPSDLTPFHEVFMDARKTGKLHEDFADLFVIDILKGYNKDGSDRMIVNAA